MLPKHGTAYAVFLLAHACRLTPRSDVADWIRSARARSSFLAGAVDLIKPAKRLHELGLVTIDGQITLAPNLATLSYTADRATLVNVSRLLLITSPPLWLRVAVSWAGVAREYIPSDELEALAWLEPELDAILIEVSRELSEKEESDFKARLGEAAELVLMAVFENAGDNPIHVAKISDAYGYDIELRRRGNIKRIEVKAASERTKGGFNLTRNEYEKYLLYGREWLLLQVVFTSAAFIAERLDCTHVQAVLELAPNAIKNTVPSDRPGFVWRTAEVTLPQDLWLESSLQVTPFAVPGFRSLISGG